MPIVYFVLISGAVGSTLYMCAGSYVYVSSRKNDGKMPAHSLAVDAIRIHPNYVHSGHEYMQKPAPGKRVIHDFWNHIYCIPWWTVLKDAIGFSYAWSFPYHPDFSEKVKMYSLVSSAWSGNETMNFDLGESVNYDI